MVLGKTSIRSGTSPPRRALLAWEFGAGRTHIANLLGVASHLAASGVQCVAALYDPRFADEFAALNIRVVQNYVWPTRRRSAAGWVERPARTLSDVLANLGFANPVALGSALAHYDGLFSLVRPDILICENAHGAMLAGRGRMPVIAFGTGSCLPPIVDGGFANHDASGDSPAWPIEHVRSQINVALEATGRPLLNRLSDLLEVDGVYPFGPVEFDLYSLTRRGPMLPPHTPGLNEIPSVGDGSEIFIYLHAFVQGVPQVLTGLANIGRPARVYIPDLTPAERAKLPASWRFERNAVPLQEILGRSRCIVHHGGPQLTSVCLAAGRPQVIIPKEFDNVLCARFVTSKQLGFAGQINEVTADWLVTAVRSAFDDAELRRRCELAAPHYAGWFTSDPTKTVADAALRLTS